MTDVAKIKKKMLTLCIISTAVLIILTLIVGTGFSDLGDTGLVGYMMAAPIFLTALAFIFGYTDINEKMKDDDVEYIVHRTYIFGGLLFIITLLAIIALYMA